ncbi:MAG TPA: zf-HC2 domain-containing protein [Ktedonobacterales bacterium]|jgi:anti-sigma factor RsiW|nr:zf-HC2 domain-containing protein [Ktedonobacterales bacterium]
MNCSQAEWWMQLYVDGRLDTRRLAQLEPHIQTCASCREDLALLELVSRTASAHVEVREPDGLTAAILLRVAELEARNARKPHVFEPGLVDALLAATLATLVTAGFLLFQPVLRQAVSQALAHALLGVNHTAIAALGDSPGWLAWAVCIMLGLLLALAFAGGEVRATWRRNLMTRLPH